MIGAAVWAAACASVQPENFSNGDCVAGGCQASGASSSGASSSSSGAACVPDAGCAVHWATDVFTGILDGPGGCTAMGACHGAGGGGLTLPPGDHHAAYVALAGAKLKMQPGAGKPYIVPCNAQASGFPCNMNLAMGTNSFGMCGSPMPIAGTTITMAQITTIADWITCGAPEN